ncbi:hypothetical protein C8R45DRAFT_1134400 [Mycena sanguinolenta]|nr:hypothetical protein C8R45DRAFT_1134400 [Mycena sanguinolenta]
MNIVRFSYWMVTRYYNWKRTYYLQEMRNRQRELRHPDANTAASGRLMGVRWQKCTSTTSAITASCGTFPSPSCASKGTAAVVVGSICDLLGTMWLAGVVVRERTKISKWAVPEGCFRSDGHPESAMPPADLCAPPLWPSPMLLKRRGTLRRRRLLVPSVYVRAAPCKENHVSSEFSRLWSTSSGSMKAIAIPNKNIRHDPHSRPAKVDYYAENAERKQKPNGRSTTGFTGRWPWVGKCACPRAEDIKSDIHRCCGSETKEYEGFMNDVAPNVRRGTVIIHA